MDSPPSKRRRTSPLTSTAVTAENTYLDQRPQNGATPSKRRSSLMSPTKASLARFYPSLLPRAKSAEPPGPVSREKHSCVRKHTVGESGTNGKRAYVAGPASEGLRSPTNGLEDGHGLLVSPRQTSQTLGERNEFTDQDQPMMNSEIRASPAEEVRHEGLPVSDMNGVQQEPDADASDMKNTGVTIIPDSQNPQVPSTPKQREAGIPTSGMGIGEDGEPSLPSTPSQLGLEPPRERPKGLLFDSPSKRLRRKARSTAKSSQFKSPALTPEHSIPRPKTPVASLGPRRYIANTPKPPPRPEEAYLAQLRTRLSDLEKQLQDIEDKLLRQILWSSWHQDRSKEGKDSAKRRKDVAQRSAKIVQLRDEVSQIEAAQRTDQAPAGPEAIDREKRASTNAPTLTQRLANFLPFATIKAPPSEPRPASPNNNNNSATPIPDPDKLQPTTEPFTITTSGTSLLSSTSDQSLLQQQNVTLSPPHHSLTCALQLTTHIATHHLSHLANQSLSHGPQPDSLTWLRAHKQKQNTAPEPVFGCWLRLPHHNKNPALAALGTAFGRYWEAAQCRSQCWLSCRESYNHLIISNPPSDSPPTTTTTTNNPPLSNLGTQSLILARGPVRLKFHWAIALDEEGKAASRSSVDARFPPSWWQQRQLGKIGDAFAMLVEDRGISDAVGEICRIVFPG